VDVIPEVFEASRSSPTRVPVLFINTVGAHVPIGFLSHQHTKDTGDLRMGHGDHGFLASTTCCQAVRQGRPVGPLGTSRGVGQWSQDGSQGLIPVAGAAVALLACAGIVPRGNPDPGRHGGRRATAGHLDPRLDHVPLRSSLADSEDRVQQSHRPDTRARHLWVPWSHLTVNGARHLGRFGRRLVGIQLHQAAAHPHASGLDLCVQNIDQRRSDDQQPPVIVLDQPRQGLLQEGGLATPVPPRQLGRYVLRPNGSIA
jgi:hypothetical protein